MSGWIGVDLDRTLAHYDDGDFRRHGPYHIGPPIPRMVERIKAWLSAGIEVRIMTARAADGDLRIITLIEKYCREHIGRTLEVTNEKDYSMLELWDDRAVGVIPNTGERADGKA